MRCQLTSPILVDVGSLLFSRRLLQAQEDVADGFVVVGPSLDHDELLEGIDEIGQLACVLELDVDDRRVHLVEILVILAGDEGDPAFGAEVIFKCGQSDTASGSESLGLAPVNEPVRSEVAEAQSCQRTEAYDVQADAMDLEWSVSTVCCLPDIIADKGSSNSPCRRCTSRHPRP